MLGKSLYDFEPNSVAVAALREHLAEVWSEAL